MKKLPSLPTLGDNIRAYREHRGKTQSEAAELAGLGGDTRWREYESGRVQPTADKLFAIADALGVKVDWLRPA